MIVVEIDRLAAGDVSVGTLRPLDLADDALRARHEEHVRDLARAVGSPFVQAPYVDGVARAASLEHACVRCVVLERRAQVPTLALFGKPNDVYVTLRPGPVS